MPGKRICVMLFEFEFSTSVCTMRWDVRCLEWAGWTDPHTYQAPANASDCSRKRLLSTLSKAYDKPAVTSTPFYLSSKACDKPAVTSTPFYLSSKACDKPAVTSTPFFFIYLPKSVINLLSLQPLFIYPPRSVINLLSLQPLFIYLPMSVINLLSLQPRFIYPFTKAQHRQKTFFPGTVAEWNNFPEEGAPSQDSDAHNETTVQPY